MTFFNLLTSETKISDIKRAVELVTKGAISCANDTYQDYNLKTFKLNRFFYTADSVNFTKKSTWVALLEYLIDLVGDCEFVRQLDINFITFNTPHQTNDIQEALVNLYRTNFCEDVEDREIIEKINYATLSSLGYSEAVVYNLMSVYLSIAIEPTASGFAIHAMNKLGVSNVSDPIADKVQKVTTIGNSHIAVKYISADSTRYHKRGHMGVYYTTCEYPLSADSTPMHGAYAFPDRVNALAKYFATV